MDSNFVMITDQDRKWVSFTHMCCTSRIINSLIGLWYGSRVQSVQMQRIRLQTFF